MIVGWGKFRCRQGFGNRFGMVGAGGTGGITFM